jgi:hypothetical protein
MPDFVQELIKNLVFPVFYLFRALQDLWDELELRVQLMILFDIAKVSLGLHILLYIVGVNEGRAQVYASDLDTLVKGAIETGNPVVPLVTAAAIGVGMVGMVVGAVSWAMFGDDQGEYADNLREAVELVGDNIQLDKRERRGRVRLICWYEEQTGTKVPDWYKEYLVGIEKEDFMVELSAYHKGLQPHVEVTRRGLPQVPVNPDIPAAPPNKEIPVVPVVPEVLGGVKAGLPGDIGGGAEGAPIVTPVEQSAIARPKSLNELLNELCGPNWASDMELFKNTVIKERYQKGFRDISHIPDETKCQMVMNAAKDIRWVPHTEELGLEIQRTLVLSEYISSLYPENSKLMLWTSAEWCNGCSKLKGFEDLTAGQKAHFLSYAKQKAIRNAEGILEGKIRWPDKTVRAVETAKYFEKCKKMDL